MLGLKLNHVSKRGHWKCLVKIKIIKQVRGLKVILSTTIPQVYNKHSIFHMPINSSLPCATYIGQWTVLILLQVIACHLFGIKPLPEPTMIHCQLEPEKKLQWNLNQTTKIFLLENVVCEVVTISSWGSCVNTPWWTWVSAWHECMGNDYTTQANQSTKGYVHVLWATVYDKYGLVPRSYCLYSLVAMCFNWTKLP